MADPKKEKQTEKQPAKQPPPPRKRPTGEPATKAPAAKAAEKPAATKAEKPAAPKKTTHTAAAKEPAQVVKPGPDAEKADGAKTNPAAKTKSAPAKAKNAPAKAEKPPEKRKPKPKPDSEQVRLKKEEQQRRTRRRNRQLIGIAITILVIVGAVSIVMNGINMAQSIFDSSDEMKVYEDRFKAFVWFDVLPFDSIAQVEENVLKQVVIWSIFDDQSDALGRNENDQAQVPASEVDRYGAELFGPDFRFSTHQSFRDELLELTYEYDTETMMYSLPTTGLNPNYLPTVVEIIRESGGVRRVVMGYVSTRNSDNQVVATPDYENPSRYVDYMLRRDGSSYYLYAIQRNETHVVAEPEPASEAQPFSIPAPLSLPQDVPSSSLPDSLAPEEESVAEDPEPDTENTDESDAA